MLSFEPRPAFLVDRAAPVARGLWCWPALAAGLALVLDGLRPMPHAGDGPGLLWLDVTALLCAGWALSGPRRARRGEWRTPIDGRVMAGLVLAVLHALGTGGPAGTVLCLRHTVAAGACFYALTARLRRDPRAPDAVWPAFAVVLLALSVFALGHATQGLLALHAACRDVDLRWASRFGPAKTLVLVTLLCIGRASEPSARALWRVTALAGALATSLCTLVGGAGLRVSSLAGLDEPFYFGTSIVAFMLLASLSRMAWQLSRERAEEAGRWRASALMFPLVAGLLLFGGGTGGEGVRVVAGLAAAVVISARIAPRAASARPGAPRAVEPLQARAALAPHAGRGADWRDADVPGRFAP